MICTHSLVAELLLPEGEEKLSRMSIVTMEKFVLERRSHSRNGGFQTVELAKAGVVEIAAP
jgi:hypothetical protein